MKITLMYNPQAGGEDLNLSNLVKGPTSRGAEVITQSTKEDGYEVALEQETDFILIAGGDGTVEKLTKSLVSQKLPIAILPAGSANNIANSLDIEATLDGIFESWHNKDFRKFSLGSVEAGKSKKFFLESVGWGLFAEVLSKRKSEKKKGNSSSSTDKKDKVESGLAKLSDSIGNLASSYYEILLDGQDHSGEYLWVEIMNTQSMGPQLQMAPQAEHGDDFLDVVLVGEGDLDLLKEFIQSPSNGRQNHSFKTVKARHIQVKTSEKPHIDDEIYEEENQHQKWVEISLFSQYFWVINALSS